MVDFLIVGSSEIPGFLVLPQRRYATIHIFGRKPELQRLEESLEKAAASKSQARETLQFIADHIGREELRSSFTQSPEVLALMG